MIFPPSSSPRFSGRYRAFTLIELLVAIAIIGTLAAMFFSALGPITNKARDIQCLNNLKTWGRLMSLFAADNRQNVWVSQDSPTVQNGITYDTIFSQISPYSYYIDTAVRADGASPRTISKLRVCPGLTTQKDDTPDYSVVRPQSDPYWVFLARLSCPSRYFLMCDSTTQGRSLSTLGDFNTYVIPTMVKASPTNFIRHSGHANMLFADFHIASVTVDDIRKCGYLDNGKALIFLLQIGRGESKLQDSR